MNVRLTCLSSALALAATGALAQQSFRRVSSFATPLNMAEGEDRSAETSAEIVAATPDGMTLLYTDSPLGALGRIDIADPAAPKARGNVMLDVEPTSVAVLGTTAMVAVNTSESLAEPSGALLWPSTWPRARSGRAATWAGSPTAWRWRPTEASWRSRSRTSATRK